MNSTRLSEGIETVAPWSALRVLALVTVPETVPVEEDWACAAETAKAPRRRNRPMGERHSRVILLAALE